MPKRKHTDNFDMMMQVYHRLEVFLQNNEITKLSRCSSTWDRFLCDKKAWDYDNFTSPRYHLITSMQVRPLFFPESLTIRCLRNPQQFPPLLKRLVWPITYQTVFPESLTHLTIQNTNTTVINFKPPANLRYLRIDVKNAQIQITEWPKTIEHVEIGFADVELNRRDLRDLPSLTCLIICSWNHWSSKRFGFDLQVDHCHPYGWYRRCNPDCIGSPDGSCHHSSRSLFPF